MASGRYKKIWTCKRCSRTLDNPQANQPQGMYCCKCREIVRSKYSKKYQKRYYNVKKVVFGAVILMALDNGGKNANGHRFRNYDEAEGHSL